MPRIRAGSSPTTVLGFGGFLLPPRLLQALTLTLLQREGRFVACLPLRGLWGRRVGSSRPPASWELCTASPASAASSLDFSSSLTPSSRGWGSRSVSCCCGCAVLLSFSEPPVSRTVNLVPVECRTPHGPPSALWPLSLCAHPRHSRGVREQRRSLLVPSQLTQPKPAEAPRE